MDLSAFPCTACGERPVVDLCPLCRGPGFCSVECFDQFLDTHITWCNVVRRRANPRAASIFRLRIELDGLKELPPVWREFDVFGGVDLRTLGRTLRVVMGWRAHGYHLDAFEVGGRTFTTPDEDDIRDVVDAFKTALCDVLPAVGATAMWEYDFGDGWEHSVQVVRICDPPWESPITLATVVDGGGLCPAEDVGGAFGWAHRVRSLVDVDGQLAVQNESWDFIQAQFKRAGRPVKPVPFARADPAVDTWIKLPDRRVVLSLEAFDARLHNSRLGHGRVGVRR